MHVHVHCVQSISPISCSTVGPYYAGILENVPTCTMYVCNAQKYYYHVYHVIPHYYVVPEVLFVQKLCALVMLAVALIIKI